MKKTKKEEKSKKDLDAVSVAQFKRLQTRVRHLEILVDKVANPPAPPGAFLDQGETKEIKGEPKEIQGTAHGLGKLNRFRGFVKRNPIFWTAGCLMLGYVLGCLICDFSTFGGY